MIKVGASSGKVSECVCVCVCVVTVKRCDGTKAWQKDDRWKFSSSDCRRKSPSEPLK